MNIKTTFMLLVLLAVVLVAVIFLAPDTPTRQERMEAERAARLQDGQKLFTEPQIAPDRIRRIVLHRGDDALEIVRRDERWVQLEPVRFELSRHAIDPLCDQLAALRQFDSVRPDQRQGATLADMSLDPPLARLNVTWEAAGDIHETTLQLGRRSIGGRAFVQLDDQQDVLVVNDRLHRTILDADPRDWRNRTLAQVNIGRLDRLAIIHGDDAEDHAVRLNKQEGRWYLDELGRQRASREMVEQLVTNLNTIQVDRFISDDPEDLARYNLDQPRKQVSLIDSDGQQSILRIGAAADLDREHFFATWSVGASPSPVIFTLTRRYVDYFDLEADELREPRLTTTAANEVREVRVDRPGVPGIHLIRSATGIQFGEPAPGYAVDQRDADEWMHRLMLLETSRFVADFAPADDAQPAYTITLHLRGTGGSERLLFYPDSQDDSTGFIALREGETVGYRFDQDDLSVLRKSRVALRNRTIMQLDPQQVRRISLDQPDGTNFTFNRVPDNATHLWQLDGYDSFERDMFNQLLRRLNQLRVASWHDQPGEIADQVTLTIERADEPTLVLRGTAHATLTDVEDTFALPDDVVRLLTAEYRPRTVLPVTMERIQTVVIHEGETSHTITRAAGGWFEINGQPVPDQEETALLFDTLAGLRVERFLTLSPQQASALTPVRKLEITTTDQTTYELTLYDDDDADRNLASITNQPLHLLLDPLEHEELQGFPLP